MTNPANEPGYRPGNRDDFERLYRSSYGRLLGTLVGVLGDRPAAEDCLQEAFEKAFRAWPGWRPDAPAEAWLHRIAVNAAVSYQRRQRLREAGEVVRRLGRPAPPPDPADAAAAGDLAAALRRLPAKQSAAIVLRHYHGYSNREIAYALGIPERTVASRLAAAKARLRALLGESPAAGGKVGTRSPRSVPSSD
jgi:RNA polymerase sigma-70 factor (ECF subfamily)